MRLNKNIRNQIVKNALTKSGLLEKEAQYQAARAVWEEQVRLYACGISDQEVQALEAQAQKLLDKLPTCIRTSANAMLADRRYYFYANIAGARIEIRFLDPAGERDYRIAPYRMDGGIPADHPLAKQFDALELQKRQLEEHKEALELQVQALVNSVPSVKKLLEAWPEAAELLPANEVTAVTGLPAVIVSDLNRMLGLPSGDKAA